MKKIVFLMMVMLLGVGGYAQEGEYVDLGLPSGTKWKTVNEKGYFKYNAAVALFGKELPSMEQWKELKEKCKWVWVDGDGNIQSGYYVLGPNGKRIFLPAAGYRGGSNGTEVNYVGTDGGYWSSTYNYDEGDAYFMYFSDDDIGVYGGYRFDGRSVRLVQD